MRNIRIILYLSFACLFFNACKDDDEVGPIVTTEPTQIYLTGGAVFLVQGQNFEDPGIDSVVNGTIVKTLNEVNSELPGAYVVKYLAENEDGITFSATRSVVVLAEGEDPGVEIEGTYSGLENDKFLNDVTIEKIATGVYRVEDFLIGRYAREPRNYGPDYEYSGLMTYKDGKFSFPVPLNAAFGELELSKFTHSFDNPITFTYGASLVDHAFNFGGATFKLVKQ